MRVWNVTFLCIALLHFYIHFIFCPPLIQLRNIFHTWTFLGQRVGSYLNLTKLFLWQIPSSYKVAQVLQVEVIRSAFNLIMHSTAWPSPAQHTTGSNKTQWRVKFWLETTGFVLMSQNSRDDYFYSRI